MGSIWAFLTQTLTVSVVAAFLLLVKWLLSDKLSPRWQYAAWGLLAIRILLPVPVSRYILLPIPLWVEWWKTSAEGFLESAYAHPYSPVGITHILPSYGASPRSVTDWLLVAYGIGAALCLLWYGCSYLRLRLLLRKGQRLDESFLEPVCRKYGLKPCPVVAVEGLDTAFVCGVFRPVIAVPAEKTTDKKILLHELLHRKYLDPLQSLLWCVLRCLHWCNPFLQAVFNRIGNDMESLCDQRVLERLEGEERRDYGGILLDMASRRYARVPGTGSISNGGRNISRRIRAIVRFKKYPRGMALVAVCILLVLLVPVLEGNAYSARLELWPSGEQELEQALAVTRLSRCTTVAGAIDTYAKGLLLNNRIYIATASPLEMQQTLAKPHGWEAGAEFESVYTGDGYLVVGLRQSGQDRFAWLAFSMLTEDVKTRTLMVPVQISREADAWVVREAGHREILELPRSDLELSRMEGAWVQKLYGAGTTGTVTVCRVLIHEVDNQLSSGNMFGWLGSFDTALKPHAEFVSVHWMDNVTYVCAVPEVPKNKVGIRMEPIATPQEQVELPQTQSGTGGGGSSYGDCHQNLVLPEDWDGTLYAGNGTGWYGDDVEEELTRYYRVGIYFDGKLTETLTVAEVDG